VASFSAAGSYESSRLGEFNAVIGNGLSAELFAANEASLLLRLLAYNLAGMLRGELEDASGTGWDLKRVQQTVLKAGARLVEHGRRRQNARRCRRPEPTARVLYPLLYPMLY